MQSNIIDNLHFHEPTNHIQLVTPHARTTINFYLHGFFLLSISFSNNLLNSIEIREIFERETEREKKKKRFSVTTSIVTLKRILDLDLNSDSCYDRK